MEYDEELRKIIDHMKTANHLPIHCDVIRELLVLAIKLVSGGRLVPDDAVSIFWDITHDINRWCLDDVDADAWFMLDDAAEHLRKQQLQWTVQRDSDYLSYAAKLGREYAEKLLEDAV